jgi:predicted secreted protein
MLQRQKIKRAVISTLIAALFIVLTAFIAFNAFGLPLSKFLVSLCSLLHFIPLAVAYDGASELYIALYYILLWAFFSLLLYFILTLRSKNSTN